MIISRSHLYVLISMAIILSGIPSVAGTPAGEIRIKYGATADGVLSAGNLEYPFSHLPGTFFKFLRPLENPPGSGVTSLVYLSGAGSYAKKALADSKDKNSRIVIADGAKGSGIPAPRPPDYFLLQCVSNHKSFAKGLFKLSPQGNSTFKAEGDMEALALPIGAIRSLMRVAAVYDQTRDRFSWDGVRSAETVPVAFESLSVSLAGGAGLIRYAGKSSPLSCEGSYLFSGDSGVEAAKVVLSKVGAYGELLAEGASPDTYSNKAPAGFDANTEARAAPKPRNGLRVSNSAPAPIKASYTSDASTDVDALSATSDAIIETDDGDYYEDMEVEVTISTLAGPSSYGNGILLRRNGDYGLMVNMTGDGRVAIYEVTPNTYNWFALKPGADVAKTSFPVIIPGQPNRLKARIEGQTLNVEINGSTISTFTVGGPKEGRAGIFVSAGNSVRFADYKVKPLK